MEEKKGSKLNWKDVESAIDNLNKGDLKIWVSDLLYLPEELDKAREEGIREGLEDILSEVENWKTHYLDTTKSEPSKTMQIGLVNVIRKMLSILTTK